MIEIFQPPEQIEHVAPDIFVVPFLTEEFCAKLAGMGKVSDKWQRNKADKNYSTLDLNIETNFPFFFSEIRNNFKSYIVPQLQKEWEIDDVDISQMFMVYYSLKAQVKLGLHHDESYITGSIKLNRDYVGAELYFPRQQFTNKNVPVGSLLLWPSRVTHPHECTTLQEGEKFALTIWTDDKNRAD